VFKVSAFKDVTAYVLTMVQQDLKSECGAQQEASREGCVNLLGPGPRIWGSSVKSVRREACECFQCSLGA
jgi:hypothetical protein